MRKMSLVPIRPIVPYFNGDGAKKKETSLHPRLWQASLPQAVTSNARRESPSWQLHVRPWSRDDYLGTYKNVDDEPESTKPLVINGTSDCY